LEMIVSIFWMEASVSVESRVDPEFPPSLLNDARIRF